MSPQRLDVLPETIRALLADPHSLQHKTNMARENYLFNFGRSVDVAAEEIATLADQLARERKARA